MPRRYAGRKRFRRRNYDGSSAVQEVKFADFQGLAYNPSPMPSTWFSLTDCVTTPTLSTGVLDMSSVNANYIIKRGTAAGQRIGRRILVRQVHAHIQLKEDFAPSGAAAAGMYNGFQYRILAVVDHQVNSAGLEAGQVMEQTDIPAAGGAVPDYLAFRDLFAGPRFTVLYDKRFSWNNDYLGSPTACFKLEKVREHRIALKFPNGLPVTYDPNGTDSTINEIQDRNIYFFMVPSHAPATSWQIRSLYRIRFTEM